MNQEIFKAKWHEMVGKIKESWDKFTDEDLSKLKGNYDEFVDAVADKYGHEKEKIKTDIHSFLVKHNFTEDKEI